MSLAYNLKLFKEIFFPRHCAVCDREIDTGLVCSVCRNNFSFNKVNLYKANRNYWSNLMTLGQPVELEDIFDRVELLYRYDGAFKEALHRVKFDKEGSLLPALQEEAAIALASTSGKLFKHYDLITCIPTSEERLRLRGFDVPWELFSNFSRQKCYTKDVLKRIKNTAPLYTMAVEERRAELIGCFALFDKAKVFNKRVLLCDDIFTTGSTMKEAGQLLLGAGAKCVGALAFCASKDNWS